MVSSRTTWEEGRDGQGKSVLEKKKSLNCLVLNSFNQTWDSFNTQREQTTLLKWILTYGIPVAGSWHTARVRYVGHEVGEVGVPLLRCLGTYQCGDLPSTSSAPDTQARMQDTAPSAPSTSAFKAQPRTRWRLCQRARRSCHYSQTKRLSFMARELRSLLKKLGFFIG